MVCTGSSWCDTTRRASHGKALCFLRAALWPFQSNPGGKVEGLRHCCSGDAGGPTAPTRGFAANREVGALHFFSSQRARLMPADAQMPTNISICGCIMALMQAFKGNWQSRYTISARQIATEVILVCHSHFTSREIYFRCNRNGWHYSTFTMYRCCPSVSERSFGFLNTQRTKSSQKSQNSDWFWFLTVFLLGSPWP